MEIELGRDREHCNAMVGASVYMGHDSVRKFEKIVRVHSFSGLFEPALDVYISNQRLYLAVGRSTRSVCEKPGLAWITLGSRPSLVCICMPRALPLYAIVQ